MFCIQGCCQSSCPILKRPPSSNYYALLEARCSVSWGGIERQGLGAVYLRGMSMTLPSLLDLVIVMSSFASFSLGWAPPLLVTTKDYGNHILGSLYIPSIPRLVSRGLTQHTQPRISKHGNASRSSDDY